jgi:hypothetical protein
VAFYGIELIWLWPSGLAPVDRYRAFFENRPRPIV